MPQIFLSIGSNINREENIQLALDALAQAFGYMRLSSVYQSVAVGFSGDDFYNLVVALYTELSPFEISIVLKAIEKHQGRSQKQKGFVARTIDIDLLTYGDYVGELDAIFFPRKEILKYAFVLMPLVEIAGEQCHPRLKKTYAQLWSESSAREQKFHVISFQWCANRKLPGFFGVTHA